MEDVPFNILADAALADSVPEGEPGGSTAQVAAPAELLAASEEGEPLPPAEQGAAPSSSSSSGTKVFRAGKKDAQAGELHPFETLPIWRIPAQPLFFAADRSVAKAVAKELCALATPAPA